MIKSDFANYEHTFASRNCSICQILQIQVALDTSALMEKEYQ